MTVSMAAACLVSCTGRAVSVRRGDAAWPGGSTLAGAAAGGLPFLIAGPGCWPSAGHAIAGVCGRGFKVVLSAEFSDIPRFSPVNPGMFPVCLAEETVAELQAAVEADPGILLTFDSARRDVRARGSIVARLEMGADALLRQIAPASRPDCPLLGCDGGAESMARRLLIAQRLLGSADLIGDTRIRLQRKLAAICDGLKAPGADPARSARRLDRLLSDLAPACEAGPAGDRRAADRRALAAGAAGERDERAAASTDMAGCGGS